MAATVPWKRTNPRYQDIQVGAPVRARTWRELALLYHWLRGHGHHVIPAHCPAVELSSGGSETFRYNIVPSGRSIHRVWGFVLRQEIPANPPTAATCTITLPDSSVVTLHPTTADGLTGISRRLFVEALASKSSTPGEIALTVAHTAGTAKVWVESICCFELPRAVLELDATDLGVDLETLRPGQPIVDDSYESAAEVAHSLASTKPLRNLVQLWFPKLVFNSGSWTDAFPIPVPALPRKGQRSDTTKSCKWDVYARVTDGSTAGDVRITTGRSANTDTLTVSSTSWSWLGTSDIELDCEVMTASDGLPGSSARETVQLAVQRTSGTGDIEVQGLRVAEEA